MNKAHAAWLAEQRTDSTGDDGRDYMIAMSISGRFFTAFPRARRFPIPESLRPGVERTMRRMDARADPVPADPCEVHQLASWFESKGGAEAFAALSAAR